MILKRALFSPLPLLPLLPSLFRIALIAPVAAQAQAQTQTQTQAELDFAHQVMPVLQEHCAECHTGEKKKGGLAMNTRAELLEGSEFGEVVTPGDAANSLMIELIHSTDEDEWMPPKRPRMKKEEIAVLEQWINQGMKWDEGIRLGKSAWEPPLKPRQVKLPAAHKGREHPIDRILDAGMVKGKQTIPELASDAAFIRRATMDVHGLLPTPDELASFLADSSPKKRELLLSKLLADDVSYADHWLTMWNDLLRNDYTGTGFITSGRTQITTWLYRSLRDNVPYDQFVRELIAPTAESAGFINGIKWRGDVNASQTREIQFSQNISQVFLGINMKCASCHDSFIDRWKLEEAYNLAAIFSDQPMELNRCDKPTGKMAKAKWIFPELGDIDPKAPKEERLKQLAGLMTHPENGRLTRTVVNRIWERLMGRGIVHPVDAMDTEPWNEDLLDYLAVRFADDGYDLRTFIGFVMGSKAYQSRSVILNKEPGADYVYTGPLAKRMTAEQFLDAIWQITKAHPGAPNAKVERAVKVSSPRYQSTGWNELAAMPVRASWVWHKGGHEGGPTGKAAEKSQLRKTIELSAVPEVAFITASCDNAFRMKINGKMIAESKDWKSPVYLDITEHLVAGKNEIDVDAEMFGGSAGFIAQLFINDAGTNKTIVTDQSWQARAPKGKWAAAKVVSEHGAKPWGNILKPKTSALTDAAPPVRAALVQNDFLMRSLGRPNRDQVVTSRPSQLTTLQAIDLANGDILASTLSKAVMELEFDAPNKEAISWLYRHALSRPPTPGEQAVMLEASAQQQDSAALEDLLWLVFMQPEFQIIR